MKNEKIKEIKNWNEWRMNWNLGQDSINLRIIKDRIINLKINFGRNWDN
jgi:hypothetical protein